MEDPFIKMLEKRLQASLPGREAQYRMAHAIRHHYPPTSVENAQKAGVLALFYPKNEEWNIVLIERDSSNPNDRHRGQISFPGGRFEPADGNLAGTALREAEEEIGIDSKDVKLLGPLTNLYIPVSNFHVSPYVGVMNYVPDFSPQASEVKSILEIPFKLFLDPSNVQEKDMTVGANLTLKGVPFFHIHNKTIWGATAMMLNELLEVVRSNGKAV